MLNLLNEQEEEIQILKRHIKRNMITRITVEDALSCARDARFYDNEEIVKAIDCIAKDLGVNLD
jgi:thermostable 8-oxoguanine DNA glycosylase